jgi:hypothetical protein
MAAHYMDMHSYDGLLYAYGKHDIYHDVRYHIASKAESLTEKNAIDLGSYNLLFEGAKPGTKQK